MTSDISGQRETREETVALLALLRTAPRGVTWGDIAGEVRLTGSALAVLDKTRDPQGTLFDPALDEAIRQAETDLCVWDKAGLNLVTVLSDVYPVR
ncbi:MAG: hypothetical protein LBG70_04530, partial [Bifidobacteriaceae bacterium]|nr:hypothetical protein [Bifidobacteriaceae bacterium]